MNTSTERKWAETISVLVFVDVDQGEFLHEMEEIEDEFASAIENQLLGEVDGSYAIAGGRQFMIYGVYEDQLADVVELVLKILTKFGFKEESVIAKRRSWRTSTSRGTEYKIVSPENCDKEYLDIIHPSWLRE